MTLCVNGREIPYALIKNKDSKACIILVKKKKNSSFIEGIREIKTAGVGLCVLYILYVFEFNYRSNKAKVCMNLTAGLHIVLFADNHMGKKPLDGNSKANKCFLFYYCSFSSDIDECFADSSPCDENADCTNTGGSYSCTCKQGFTGDGTTCDGKPERSQKLSYHTTRRIKLRSLLHH